MDNCRLKDLRIYANMTQEDVAKAVNKKQVTISAYEIGTRKPDHNTKKLLADLFGVTVDYLFYDGELGNSKVIVKSKEDEIQKEFERELTPEDRIGMIESLNIFTERSKKALEKLNDRALISEYRKMLNI